MHYNSSTLPPSIDESDLNGATLQWVEVTKTTNADGTVTYSYVVVTKTGDTFQTYNETDTAVAESGSSAASLATDGSSDSSVLSSSVLIAIITGAFVVLVLLIGFFVFRRHRSRRERDTYAYDGLATPSSAQQYPVRNSKSSSSRDTPSIEITKSSKSATAHSSHRSDSQRFLPRRSGSLWEDEAIIAARVPFDLVQIGELLGQGAFGEVYLGKFRDQHVAIKRLLPQVRKNMGHIEGFLAEIKLLASMEHPSVVQFVGVAWDSLSDLMCLTEFMAGGDLRTLLIEYHEAEYPNGFDESKVQIALQVTHGLTYLHSLSPTVLHRDLKSRNILLSETLQAKLTDFGISRESSDRTMTAGVGSILWMAPEVMMGMRYDEKADVFSLGVVLSELDTHELPYAHAKDSQTGVPLADMALLQLVTMGRLKIRLSDRLQPHLRHLISACMNPDPCQRPTAAQALHELQLVQRSLRRS